MFYILRRTGLGLGSTKAIKELSKEEISIVRNDKLPEYFSEDDVILRWGCTSVLPTYPQYSYPNSLTELGLLRRSIRNQLRSLPLSDSF